MVQYRDQVIGNSCVATTNHTEVEMESCDILDISHSDKVEVEDHKDVLLDCRLSLILSLIQFVLTLQLRCNFYEFIYRIK